jgi:hypothetical protein
MYFVEIGLQKLYSKTFLLDLVKVKTFNLIYIT